MARIAASIGVTLVIMYVVAFLVYGAFSAFLDLEPPTDGSPAEFLISIFVVKLGLAVGFVLLFFVARKTWAGRWPLYAAIWWLMFAVTELGQAIGPGYSWTEAIAGIIAEAVYCPLSAFLVARLLGTKVASA
jgi:hypothetical protein